MQVFKTPGLSLGVQSRPRFTKEMDVMIVRERVKKLIGNLMLLLAGGVLLVSVSCAAPGGSPSATSDSIPIRSTAIMSPTLTPASEPGPVSYPDAFAAARALGRGVNMGNALDAPSEGEWGIIIKEGYFDLIRDAGFNGVRIPVRWSTHARKEAPYTIEPRFFTRVDQVVGWALERGLVVVLNIHHYEEMAVDPEGHEQRFLALWEQIARHYKDYSHSLFFELLNEPNGALTSSLWNRLSGEALAIVRKTNPERTVIIGGASWNAYDQLQFLELPADDQHIIANYHYYNPFEFTHQGAEWVSGSGPWLGTTWEASDPQKEAVTAHLDAVADWAGQHNLPVYMGEFGAYSKADMESRARWTSFLAREAEARGFAWAYWEFCAGFGVYEPVSKTWRSPLLKALIP
jgi:endoglucanase